MRSRLFIGVVAVLVGFGIYRWMSGGRPTTPAPEIEAPGRDTASTPSQPETTAPAAAPSNAPVPTAAPTAAKTATIPPLTPATQANAPSANPAAPTPVPPAPAAAPVADSCHSMTFSHQAAEGHEDGEACLYHKNLIKLAGVSGEINPKTVCVRVNGKPAKFKFVPAKPEAQVLLGSLAGPTTKISVTFCTGKMTCAADCTVPKDDFMEAIGGAETDEDLFTDRASKVGWKKGKNPQKEEETLRRELAELKKNLKDELKKGSLFEGWELSTTAPASCGRAHAAQR